eukprot:1142261-Pelagomonas_calceolata.AAC.3
MCRPCVHAEEFGLGKSPTTRDAQAISDTIFASFVSKEVDKVELVSASSLVGQDCPHVRKGCNSCFMPYEWGMFSANKSSFGTRTCS